MNQKNLDYLKDQVKFTGFGEEREGPLKAALERGAPEFALKHNTRFSNDDVAAMLYFKKSAQTDMYFFNRYDVTLKPEGSKEDMTQTFYINKGSNTTLKEAYNLMNGRAVNKDLTTKEGQVYNAWVQLDFKQTDTHGNYKLKQFHQNYGYDLDAALVQYWSEHHYENPVHIFSHEIMRLAKISATRTYHKIIRDLSRYGYIRYEPSFKKNRGSKVYLLNTGR